MMVVVMSIFLVTGVKSGYADVEPNQYKEKEVRINTDYFHDEALLERKESLPDEVKELTFLNDELSVSELAKEMIFQSTVHEQTVIETKAKQFALFSAEVAYGETSDYAVKERSVGVIQFVLIIVAAVCIVCIFVLTAGKMNTNVRKKQ